MPYLMTGGGKGKYELHDDPFPGEGGPVTPENRVAKSSYNKFLRGERADPEHLPRTGYVPEPFKHDKPFLAYPRLFCKPEVKAVIEELEPGIHQFVPYQIRQGEDGPVVAEFEYINLCEPLDTIDVEPSDPRIVRLAEKVDHHEERTVLISLGGLRYFDDAHIALDETKIGNRHLWAEKRCRDSSITFISDKLYEALQPYCTQGFIDFFKTI
ncbi:MAG: DUF1629 domain-containing protein [Pseudomonadota bacterium]